MRSVFLLLLLLLLLLLTPSLPELSFPVCTDSLA